MRRQTDALPGEPAGSNTGYSRPVTRRTRDGGTEEKKSEKAPGQRTGDGHEDLGARYRHLRRQLPTFKAAVKAMARYLAVLIYRLLTRGEAWVDRGAAQFERRRAEREMESLNSKARAKGYTLIPIAEAC